MSDPITQVAKAIKAVDAKAVVVRTGTSLSGTTGVQNSFTVALDGDPSGTPVTAVSADGLIPQGVRVLLLAYPTRGLVALGRLDGSAAFNRLSATSLTVPNMRAVQYTNAGPASLFSTTYVTLGTGTTFTYPPSGMIVISISARLNISAAGANRLLMAAQIRTTNGAGAITHAFNDAEAVECSSTTLEAFGRTFIATGLPTSGTGWIEVGGRVTNAAITGTFENVIAVVQPQP